MERIRNLIKSRKDHLAGHPFFEALRSEEISGERKMLFAPAMFFYVLAFKDLLTLMHQSPSDDPVQKIVNTYTAEDGSHYLWYLDDLKAMGFTLPESLDLWNSDLLNVRKTIYRLIGYVLEHNAPLIKLVLVMVFEATGDVFLGHTYHVTKSLGLHKNLRYFGEDHFHDESSHTVKDDQLQLLDLRLTQDVVDRAVEMIDISFSDYDALFNCWYEKMMKNTHNPVLEPIL